MGRLFKETVNLVSGTDEGIDRMSANDAGRVSHEDLLDLLQHFRPILRIPYSPSRSTRSHQGPGPRYAMQVNFLSTRWRNEIWYVHALVNENRALEI